MSTIFGSVLRGINRSSKDKLNILSLNTDEKFQWMLSKTGHSFYYLYNATCPRWNYAVREKPDNCIETNDLTGIDIDLILCQHKYRDYASLMKLKNPVGSCCIIGVNNFLPIPDINQFTIQALADATFDREVFCSTFVCNAWGIDNNEADIIPPCIDTDIFKEWMGGDGKVLLNVDFYYNRQNINGYQLLEKISTRLPLNVIGITPGLSRPANDLYDLVLRYKRASVFLNTSSYLACPYELLEAMSVGCPIVTTKTTDIPNFVVDGENGFITNDPEEIVGRCLELIQNKTLAKKIGDNARQTIVENFGCINFIEKWNDIFYSAIDKTSLTWTKKER